MNKHTSDGGSTGYYDIPKDARDLDDLIALKKMSFRMGNIFKACYRLDQKAGTDKGYDLRKIIFFAQRELEMVEKEQWAATEKCPCGRVGKGTCSGCAMQLHPL